MILLILQVRIRADISEKTEVSQKCCTHLESYIYLSHSRSLPRIGNAYQQRQVKQY